MTTNSSTTSTVQRPLEDAGFDEAELRPRHSCHATAAAPWTRTDRGTRTPLVDPRLRPQTAHIKAPVQKDPNVRAWRSRGARPKIAHGFHAHELLIALALALEAPTALQARNHPTN
jgi:hypothetical protein